MSEFDARPLNWRFVVPGETGRLMLLPTGDELLPGAEIPPPTAVGLRRVLMDGPYAGVAVADLGRWAAVAGTSPEELLQQVTTAVSPGGWIYASFANPLYPGRPRSPGSVRLGRVKRALRWGGIGSIEVYLPFPDHRCPAYLVSTGREELDHFLRRLFHPYVQGSAGFLGLARQVLQGVMHAIAVRAPHLLRIELAPAYAVVGVSPK